MPVGLVVLPVVAADPSGLPVAPGVVASLVRIPELLLDGLVVGAPIVVTRADGSQVRRTVVSRAVLDVAATRATAGALTLVAPAGGDSWTVIVAR